VVTHGFAIDSTVVTVLFSCGSSRESSVPEMDTLTELEINLAPLNKETKQTVTDLDEPSVGSEESKGDAIDSAVLAGTDA
jgi:hypothetical protein